MMLPAIAKRLNMGKLSVYLFWLLFLLQPFHIFAQSDSSLYKTLKREQENFVRHLKDISNDSVIVYPLAKNFISEVDAIYASLKSHAGLSLTDREKAARSLVYFIKELGESITQQKLDIYDIPGSLQSYRHVLEALLYHKPFAYLMQPLGPRRSQLLTAAFSQYNEHFLMDDISVYKRVASSPDFILQFLEDKPAFRFADSLLLVTAAHDPLKLVSYLNKDNSGIQDKIRKTKNLYLRQIVTLSGDKNASELLPFITQLSEKKITPEEILEKRTNVVQYYQLLVNSLKESMGSKDSSSIFLKPLRDGLKEKSLSFFVNPINELHSAPDAKRFASVKDLRPDDIYYIITSSGDELYTSSYLGLYKRLMEYFKDGSADSLFDIVRYDNFRVFMRLAANYNVLTDFLRRMPPERATVLVRRFITGIESDTESALEKAMDIADSFTGLGSALDVSEIIGKELKSNFDRCRLSRQYLGMRLYSILLQVFDLIKQDKSLNKLWAKLGNYEILERGALENERGEIIQLVLFYGDGDGIASFNNFLKLYTDHKRWSIYKNEDWISIRSISDRPLVIYANRPLDMKEELDLAAQDSLIAFLQQQSLEPSVLIHRGHSYHLEKTLKRLKPSVKLAILGSCGGYNKAISVAGFNRDVQVIGSKKTGAKSVNDPIIDMINETLIANEDLSWPEIWKKLEGKFGKDQKTLSLFNEYFSPSNNVSLFVLKLFIYYNRFVTEGRLAAYANNP